MNNMLTLVVKNSGKVRSCKFDSESVVKMFNTSNFFHKDELEWDDLTSEMEVAKFVPSDGGLVVVDVGKKWVGYAIKDRDPFKYVVSYDGDFDAGSYEFLNDAWKNNLLEIQFDVDIVRNGLCIQRTTIRDLKPSEGMKERGFKDSWGEIVEKIMDDVCGLIPFSRNEGDWKFNISLKGGVPSDWKRGSFFDKGNLYPTEDWALFIKVLLGFGFEFSDAEKVQWRRFFQNEKMDSIFLLDEIVATEKSKS